MAEAAPTLAQTTEALPMSVQIAEASPIPAQTAEVDPAIDGCSVSSEVECPVCYQLFCEPVRAGCDRHVFCRNCLLKAQRTGRALKCPICRAEWQRSVQELPEAIDMVEKIRIMDPEYDERVVAAKKEREELIQARRSREFSLSDSRASRQFEVCGAGTELVNGLYVAGVLPTYVGPTVYRKPNTYFFIFRWHQTQWIIAELQGPYSMGNEQEWLYRAPAQYPHDIPPVHGWEVAGPEGRARACSPAPECRILHATSTSPIVASGASPMHGAGVATRHVALHAAIVRRRSRQNGSSIGSSGDTSLEDVWWPANGGLEGDQVRCRCGPTCCVM